ncbi:MAG: (2Fe-2S) ferredoxin domain-containing protein [Ruminococcaceae bacterium]|nr:(2Fe-2S) ferredoxin domain-containing protein [Oscillospiraceae bacterium]
MKITVCIGSACHLKGSGRVVDALHRLIAENGVGDKVELGGAFCTGNCQQGVCVTIGEQVFSVTDETAEEFFKTQVLANL